MFTQYLRAAPRPLIAASTFFFAAAFFAVRFPDVPGAVVGSYVSTFLIALPSVLALFAYLGARGAVISLAALALFGYAIETVGVVTGFPYGPFYYGDALGAGIFGLVPFLLPVSYAPLVIGAVAASWSPDLRHRWLWVLRSALLLTLIDGVLDPGAASLGFWVWPEGGPYYGVPLSNYAGWLFSGALAAALLIAAGRWEAAPPPGLLDSAVVALAFWVGVAVFSGLLLPALLGASLFAYLLHRRARLGSHRPKTTPDGRRV
ncbi:MAG TPA: carotenoid biosynthesis protein [Rubrobacteraceae bacterium]|nr:carotenoid biosynthesis protein [Rubrobacteraceae bacterium]